MPTKTMSRHQTGFTLLELIVATFIFGIIAAGVAGFSVYYFQNYSFFLEENQAINQAQQAMTVMVREIREARNGDNGAWPLATADDNNFVFYSDVTNDGRSDQVRYFLDGVDLKKGVTEPTAVPVTYPPVNEKITSVASSVDTGGTPIFTYYNGDWPADQINNPLVPASRQLSTRLVRIYLRINISPNAGAQPFELSSSVQIRSLKDNL